MKYSKYVMAVSAFFLLLPFSAFARTKDSGSLYLASPANLGSKQLDAGNYKVRWTGSTDKVNVDILQRNKTVATTQAKLIELPKPSRDNSVQTNDLTNQIQQINFDGQRDALVLSSTNK